MVSPTANDVTGNTWLCLSHLISISQSAAWLLGHTHHTFTISHAAHSASLILSLATRVNIT